MRGRIKNLEIGTPRLYSGVDETDSTTSATPTDLGGPSVTIQVPANSFVSVYAQADLISSVANLNARMYLVEENGDFSASQVFVGGNAWQTRGTVPVDGSTLPTGGTIPLVGPLTFPASEGTRVYTLQYSVDAGATASFRNRKLWVWTLG